MNIAERERAVMRVCFAREAPDADLSVLGERERWLLYRQMVRSRIEEMVRAGLPRTTAAMGEKAWTAALLDWMAEHPPRTPYLRDVALEFHNHVAKQWRNAAPEHPWFVDLAHYEATRWDLAHGEAAAPPDVREFAFEGVPVISASVRVLTLQYPVQRSGGAPERFAAEPTQLAVYRRADDHKVGFLELTPFRADLLRAWQGAEGPATESARATAGAHQRAIDPAFVTDLGEFCAELLSRTVLLGSLSV